MLKNIGLLQGSENKEPLGEENYRGWFFYAYVENVAFLSLLLERERERAKNIIYVYLLDKWIL